MKENQWKSVVIADAENKGICNEYAELMRRSKTLDDILYLYRRGVDWSLENDCPSYELMRKYPEERLDLRGIFIDKHFNGEVLDERDVYIFHHCSGIVRTGLNVGKKIIPMLYFANGCDMRVECAHRLGIQTRVPMYIFGENNVIGEESEDMQCLIFNHTVK